jgi:purine catabolism regulator
VTVTAALTLKVLVDERDLGIRVRHGHRRLDEPVGWVAISELPDPTPWLEGAGLLLTSGMWLKDASDLAGRAEEWAGRLAGAGIRAVGFGLEPWFSAVPDHMLDAVERHGITLLELPPTTPFVAVDRRVAELGAAEARRQEVAVGRSQQRLVTAARGGAAAVVRRLAQEIGGWVVTLDARHESAERAGDLGTLDMAALRELAGEAATRSSHSLLTEAHGEPVYLVPLGLVGNREGTLCVDGGAISANTAQRAGLVGAAAAILSVLSSRREQSVIDVVVELLLAGDEAGARRVCSAAKVSFPDRVVAVSLLGPRRHEAAELALALGAWPVPPRSSSVSVIAGEASLISSRIPAIVERTGTRAGVSSSHAPRDLARAVQEAQSSAALTTADQPTVDYRATATAVLTGVLGAEPARQFASTLLSPLGSHPERDTLLTSAAAWVQAHGRWDPASAALGIHRETLRARLNRLATILGLNLHSFHDRLALSLALEALFEPAESTPPER